MREKLLNKYLLKSDIKYIVILSLIFLEGSVFLVDDAWGQPKRGVVIPEPTEVLPPANATNTTLINPGQIDTRSVNGTEPPNSINSLKSNTPHLISNATDIEDTIENKTLLNTGSNESQTSSNNQ
ncbi:MAG TPA: hypothetical protein VJ772_01960 [Nitrososphaeraceae archaeon]|nr:hypothetical protein [Nitrososphaeraceae archaeon]